MTNGGGVAGEKREPTEWEAAQKRAGSGCLVLILGLLLLAGLGWAWSAFFRGSDEKSKKIDLVSFPGTWPFTVPEGTLHCRDGRAITFTTNGTE